MSTSLEFHLWFSSNAKSKKHMELNLNIMANQLISAYAYSVNICSACFYRIRIICKYMQICPKHVFIVYAYVGN